jgi:hypothetical protein
MFDTGSWKHYNCPTCRAPVKLERVGSNSDRDPTRYEFDGVELTPEDCKILASIIYAYGPVSPGLYEKLVKYSRAPRQPGRQHD